MARAVVPRTAAAVDHADTELIGHDGKLETPGVFVVVLGNDSRPESVNCLRGWMQKRCLLFLHGSSLSDTIFILHYLSYLVGISEP